MRVNRHLPEDADLVAAGALMTGHVDLHSKAGLELFC